MGSISDPWGVRSKVQNQATDRLSEPLGVALPSRTADVVAVVLGSTHVLFANRRREAEAVRLNVCLLTDVWDNDSS